LVQKSKLGFPIQDKNIVLVDNHAPSGHGWLFVHGRPRQVQLCVLIDRDHRKVPTEAAYAGRSIQTVVDGVEKLLMEK
jgi:pyrimidine operon attenuation protein / uracil phosphoribosyltransferase